MKKLFALILLSTLGLSMSAAQAQGFDHRDRGYHHTARHGDFRHGNGRHVRHHGHHNRHHDRNHNRHNNRGHHFGHR